MSEMIETVAKALFGNALGALDPAALWQDEDEDIREDYRQQARVAIQAMRKPTEAMCLAAHDVMSDPVTGMDRCASSDEIWPAMIDAALA